MAPARVAPRRLLGVWLMSRRFDFDGLSLAASLKATFGHRKTQMEPKPVALTPEFSESVAAARLRTAFVRRGRSTAVPDRFAEVVSALADFLSPVAGSSRAGETFHKKWKPPGPWTE